MSDVILDNGVTTFTLQQVSQTEDQITVTVPATLPADLYDLRVVKDDKVSNKNILAVKPAVTITRAKVRCGKRIGALVVLGSGFGEKIEGWTDNRIRAYISNCASATNVTVKALFGTDQYGN